MTMRHGVVIMRLENDATVTAHVHFSGTFPLSGAGEYQHDFTGTSDQRAFLIFLSKFLFFWWRKALKNIYNNNNHPTNCHCDHQSCRFWAENEVQLTKSFLFSISKVTELHELRFVHTRFTYFPTDHLMLVLVCS